MINSTNYNSSSMTTTKKNTRSSNTTSGNEPSDTEFKSPPDITTTCHSKINSNKRVCRSISTLISDIHKRYQNTVLDIRQMINDIQNTMEQHYVRYQGNIDDKFLSLCYNFNDKLDSCKTIIQYCKNQKNTILKIGKDQKNDNESKLQALKTEFIDILQMLTKTTSSQSGNYLHIPYRSLSGDYIMKPKELYNGNKGNLESMMYIGNENDKNEIDPSKRGRIYLSFNKKDSTFMCYNLKDGDIFLIDKRIHHSLVTAMTSDKEGQIWTGHKNGTISCWNFNEPTKIARSEKYTNSSIKTVYVSDSLVAWVGCEKGTICKFATTEQFYIKKYGFMHNPEISGLAPNRKLLSRRRETNTNIDAQVNCSMTELTYAHSGNVSCIFCKDGLVMSAGGTSRSPELVFWNECSHTITQFKSMHSLSKFGYCNCMTSVDNKNEDMYNMTLDWCLLTAHETGQLVLWKPDPLTPLLKIKEKDSPIKSLVANHSLKLWITGHQDGTIKYIKEFNNNFLIPRMFSDDNLSESRDNYVLPTLQHCQTGMIKTHKGAVLSLFEHFGSIVSGSLDGKIMLLPKEYLRQEAFKSNMEIFDISDDCDTWLPLPPIFEGNQDDGNNPVMAGPSQPMHSNQTSAFAMGDKQQQGIGGDNGNGGSGNFSQLQKKFKRLDSGLGQELVRQRKMIDRHFFNLIENDFLRQARLDPGAIDPHPITSFIISRDDISYDNMAANQLGKGSYGRVLKGRVFKADAALKFLESDENLMAQVASGNQPETFSTRKNIEVLLMKTDSNKDSLIDHLVKEVKILNTINHAHIVGFIGVCLSPVVIAMEYCKNGSLYKLLKKLRNQSKDQKQIVEYRPDCEEILRLAYEIASAMMHLHSKDVEHGDLKSPNILLDGCFNVKVSDFGSARLLINSSSTKPLCHGVTNPKWLAPEVIAGQNYTKKADVFSYGVIMWEMLTFQNPWNHLYVGQKDEVVLHQIRSEVSNGRRLPVPKSSDNIPIKPFPIFYEYVLLMQKCWHSMPDERPTFKDIIIELDSLIRRLDVNDAESSGLNADSGSLANPSIENMSLQMNYNPEEIPSFPVIKDEQQPLPSPFAKGPRFSTVTICDSTFEFKTVSDAESSESVKNHELMAGEMSKSGEFRKTLEYLESGGSNDIGKFYHVESSKFKEELEKFRNGDAENDTIMEDEIITDLKDKLKSKDTQALQDAYHEYKAYLMGQSDLFHDSTVKNNNS